ncbi:coproporphyrinogen III oxidase family protein [Candidatus Woesearchaeota archaeon]|nr:coproporphyrinogen III oxidase family protein [Candidatus Woesearchaeota archaeon]
MNDLLDKALEVREKGISRPPEQYRIRVTYPPLATIESTVDEEKVRSSLLSGAVYIHYPFCSNRCGSCHFELYEDPEGYAELLIKNILMLNVEPTSLHIGGGTPTSMEDKDFHELLHFLFSHTGGSGIEVTVETRPDTLMEKIDVLRKYQKWITRLSIGVQDFNDHVLAAIKRGHTAQQAIAAIDAAREAGFTNVNIDLMYGLPDQTLRDWERNLDMVLKLEVPSVTTYHLDIREDRPVHDLYQRAPYRFPDEDDNLLMHVRAVERLESAGYVQDPVDWFVKGEEHGYRHQHQKWAEGRNLIAFGASAYWFVNGCVGENLPWRGEYESAVNQGRLPMLKAEKLSIEEIMARMVVFGLKTRNGANVSTFLRSRMPYVRNVLVPNLEKAGEIGLIEKDNGCVRLTDVGKLYADEVSAMFFTQKRREQTRGNMYLY